MNRTEEKVFNLIIQEIFQNYQKSYLKEEEAEISKKEIQINLKLKKFVNPCLFYEMIKEH